VHLCAVTFTLNRFVVLFQSLGKIETKEQATVKEIVQVDQVWDSICQLVS
jgi:hypothetical protein